MQHNPYYCTGAMCTLNVKMDDQVVNRMRPLFDGDKAMNKWIETVLHKAMVEYADELESTERKETETKKMLERLEELKNDPDGFFKMGGILGLAKDTLPWRMLREEAMLDRYGV